MSECNFCRNSNGEVASDSQGAGKLLRGKRAAVVLLSEYPSDPRPRREAETLVAEGMEVDVICIKGKPSDPSRERVRGVQVFRLPIYHRRGGKMAYLYQYGAFFLLAFVWLTLWRLKRRYHVVHVHNMPDFLVFSAAVPKILGAKVILDLHDPMPELMRTIFGLEEATGGVRILKFLEKLSLAFADGIVTVSQTFRNVFCSRSCPPGKIRVVMNSPDEKVFPFREPVMPAAAQTDRPYVLMFHGSLVERHGLGLAVEALAKVRKVCPQVVLRVYGKRTPHLDDVLQRVERLGMQGAVEYRGPESLEGIVRAIDECDLGIVPNLKSVFTELNTPTRIFEFLTRGKPVIAPSGRGVREYFDPGELLFFALGDAGDLAASIEHAIAHPSAVYDAVCKGQEVCRAHRWNLERQNLVTLVESLSNPRRPGMTSPATTATSISQ